MSSNRQLAAIMFTDIVGYTALMGKDSSKALALVEKSKEIQQPLVEKHNGRWLKEMGDGVLAQFNSALDAVNCAIEIQKSARAELDAKLRIGIHSGDVTVKDNDVYGDGVNVASRLESIADPGGIYVSDAIEKAIRGQSNVQAKYLGEITLKNVDYDVRTYALQGVGLPVPDLKEDKNLSGRFIAELQRRGVLRAVATYIVLSILLILVFPYVISVVDLPTWLNTVLYSILIAGFPIALYMAWNYERSPQGFVHTSSKESWQNPYKGSQKKPLTSKIIIAVMAAIILILYLQKGSLNKTTDKAVITSNAQSFDKSIAVLPFLNISNDPDQEYFSDGIMEEILNHLYKIDNIRIPSKTTLMLYKRSQKAISEIARELNVTYILEGNVRKDGNKVRIDVRLIDPIVDRRVWSETYDKKLEDIFTIQSDVAKRIAFELEAVINPDVIQRIENVPTKDPYVYDLYLRAKSLYYENSIEAEEILKEIINIDTNFAPGYSLLGMLWLEKGAWWGNLRSEEVIKNAKPLLEKARSLNSQHSDVHHALAKLYIWYLWDFESAGKEFNILSKLNPSDPLILDTYINYLHEIGKLQEALERVEYAIEIDPLSDAFWNLKALTECFSGRYKDAEETMKMLSGDEPYILLMKGRIYLYLGKFDQSILAIEKVRDPFRNTPRFTSYLSIAYYKTGKEDVTISLVEDLKLKSDQSPVGSPAFYVALAYSSMHEIDLAFKWLEKSFEDHEMEMINLKIELPFEPLHSDPRWQVMLDKVGFQDK